MYPAIELAKYIVSKCIKENQPISNLQLQKILYYIQKTFLNYGRRAFSDNIEAWQFGPVVPDVYYYFCGFGSMPISLLQGIYRIEEGDKVIVDRITEEKRILNPWDLVAETHRSNGAWAKVYRNGAGNHQVIPIEMIRMEG